MQTANFRYVLLATVLLVGAGLYASLGETHGAERSRWPGSEITLQAADWSTGPLLVEQDSAQTAIVSRVFQHQNGSVATFTLVTSGAPKLYGAGAEVPFLGSGFQVETPGRDLVPTDATVNALVARRGTEQWLVLYAYGERRGLLGNGLVPWGLAIFDGLVGHSNDYYKMYLASRADELNGEFGRELADLASTVFPQVAGWYRASA